MGRDPSQIRLTASVGVRRLLERSPEAYLRWVRWRIDHPNPLEDDSELLIDGFPSSANSYTRAWIHFANPDARIASHQHSGALVAAAVRRGIPTIVPYREPLDTVTSMLTRFPRYRMAPPHGARRLLEWYVRYHQPVLANLEGIVLVPFEQATSDLTPTVEELNRRFDTSFVPLGREHWPKVLEYLREKDSVHEDNETRVSAPSEAKELAKERYRTEVGSDELAGVRQQAVATYEALQSSTAAR